MKLKIVKPYQPDFANDTLALELDKKDLSSKSLQYELNEIIENLKTAYYAGSKIVITTPNGTKTFHNTVAKPWFFEFVEIDINDLYKFIPKISGYKTALLLYNKLVLETKRPKNWLQRVHYLNEVLFKAVNDYNTQTIRKIKDYKNPICNDFVDKFSLWISQEVRKVVPFIKGKRPVIGFGTKNFIETSAELEFLADTSRHSQNESLTEEQRAILNRYAVPFGIVNDVDEIGQRYVSESIILTSQGYANVISVDEIRKDVYINEDEKDYIRVKSYKIRDTGLEREQFECLLYVMKNAKDLPNYGLVPGYTICPVCGEIMRELDACPNGCIPGIKVINLDSDLSDYIEEDDITCDISGSTTYKGFAVALSKYFDRHPKLKDVTSITERITNYFENDEYAKKILKKKK